MLAELLITLFSYIQELCMQLHETFIVTGQKDETIRKGSDHFSELYAQYPLKEGTQGFEEQKRLW